MNRQLANLVIDLAYVGSAVGFSRRDQIEEEHGGAGLSTLLDQAWDWAEKVGDPILARRAERAFNHLTGRDAEGT